MSLKTTIIIIVIVLAVAFFVQSMIQKEANEKILNSLDNTATQYLPFYSFVKEELVKGSLIGLTLYLIFTNIPMLPGLPAEAIVLYTFLKGTNILGIVTITTLVYIIFASIYYSIGYFFGKRLVEKIIKKPIEYNRFLDKLSGVILFLVYLIPIPLPVPLAMILVLIFGSYKTSFKKVVTAVGIATFLRFLIVIFLYQYYSPSIEQYLTPISSWLKLS